MTRLKDARITATMAKAGLMYEDGYNAAEVARHLKCSREYVLWALRVQKIPVDDATLSPTGHAGKRWAREWNKAREVFNGQHK